LQTQLEQRLDALKAEYQAGQGLLAELETRQLEVRQTMLRISGAIQVLEELLAQASTDSPSNDGHAESPQSSLINLDLASGSVRS
jgi:DNA transposition AAA+ family ATPase